MEFFSIPTIAFQDSEFGPDNRTEDGTQNSATYLEVIRETIEVLENNIPTDNHNTFETCDEPTVFPQSLDISSFVDTNTDHHLLPHLDLNKFTEVAEDTAEDTPLLVQHQLTDNQHEIAPQKLEHVYVKPQNMFASDATQFVIPSPQIHHLHQSNVVHHNPTAAEATVQPVINPFIQDVTRLVSYISAKAAIDGNQIVPNLPALLKEASAEQLQKLCPTFDVQEFSLLYDAEEESHKFITLFQRGWQSDIASMALLSNHQGTNNDIEPVAGYAQPFVNNQMLNVGDHDVEAHPALTLPQGHLAEQMVGTSAVIPDEATDWMTIYQQQLGRDQQLLQYMPVGHANQTVQPGVVTGNGGVYVQSHAAPARHHVIRGDGQAEEEEDEDRILPRHTEGTPNTHNSDLERPRRRKRGRDTEGGLSDEELLRRRPKKKRRAAKFEKPVPSRFCHVCSRTPKNVKLAVCAKIKEGTCRKVICEKCFSSFGYGNFVAALDLESSVWLCPHCCGTCPERAQCRTYQRINDRLRVSRLRQESQTGGNVGGTVTGHQEGADNQGPEEGTKRSCTATPGSGEDELVRLLSAETTTQEAEMEGTARESMEELQAANLAVTMGLEEREEVLADEPTEDGPRLMEYSELTAPQLPSEEAGEELALLQDMLWK